jgi:hypothetical protein
LPDTIRVGELKTEFFTTQTQSREKFKGKMNKGMKAIDQITDQSLSIRFIPV